MEKVAIAFRDVWKRFAQCIFRQTNGSFHSAPNGLDRRFGRPSWRYDNIQTTNRDSDVVKNEQVFIIWANGWQWLIGCWKHSSFSNLCIWSFYSSCICICNIIVSDARRWNEQGISQQCQPIPGCLGWIERGDGYVHLLLHTIQPLFFILSHLDLMFSTIFFDSIISS